MESNEALQQVEKLLNQWTALRVTEAYRRVNFTTQRDDALEQWRLSGPHSKIEHHFIQHRLSRSALALRDVVELEEKNDATFAVAQEDLDRARSLDGDARADALAKLQTTCSRAIREDMRYRTTLLTTYQHETNELINYIDERLHPREEPV